MRLCKVLGRNRTKMFHVKHFGSYVAGLLSWASAFPNSCLTPKASAGLLLTKSILADTNDGARPSARDAARRNFLAGANAKRRKDVACRRVSAGPGRAVWRLSDLRPGHYDTWACWRRDKSVDPALRALVRSYEYEDWPRGRIVFDRARDLFILYADCVQQ